MSETPACTEHRAAMAALDRRLSVLETVIGSNAEDGIRGMLTRMSDQITTLTTAVQALQLAQAKATGALEGAGWMGRAIWAVLGAAVSTAALKLLTP